MFKKIEMVRRIFLIFCAIFVINGMINGSALAADRDVIIGFHQSDDKTKEKLVHDNGGKVKKTFHIISAVSASMSDENITKMKKDPNVAYIENDSVYQAADEYTNSWGVQHIHSNDVHSQGIYGDGVNIAVLDTGIDYNHEDLKNNYKGGYNIVFDNADPFDDSYNSHGTHVSGIIAAEDNNVGVIGVAPHANIYAVKVLDGSGFGMASWVIAGLQWAVDHNMNIATMSISCIINPDFPDYCDSIALRDTANNAYDAGLLLVAAGGNTNGGSVTFPAVYDNVIAVSATDPFDQIAYFSAIGPEIELAAPGVDIYSTVKGGYSLMSGTSMSAPHVTGVAALIYSTNFEDVNGDGEKNNEDVRELLHRAKDLGSAGIDSKFGYGLVDASMSVLGTPAPEPGSFDLTLIRTKGSPIGDAQKVDLLQGDYSVDIHNVDLKEVKMRVYENGVLQKHLSRDFKFNKKIKEIGFDLTVNSVTVVFIPYGKKGSTGYVTIRRL